MIVFDKVDKPTGTEPSRRPAVKLAGQLGKTRTIWYNGDIKKNPRQQVRPECSKLISQYIRPKVVDRGTDELNDKQEEKIKKKKLKIVYYVTTWGSKTT